MTVSRDAFNDLVRENERLKEELAQQEEGLERLKCVEFGASLEMEKVHTQAAAHSASVLEIQTQMIEDRAAIRAGKGLDDVLGMLIAATGGCPNADDDCCPSTEECKVGEALALWKENAAAIARATVQEGAKQ